MLHFYSHNNLDLKTNLLTVNSYAQCFLWPQYTYLPFATVLLPELFVLSFIFFSISCTIFTSSVLEQVVGGRGQENGNLATSAPNNFISRNLQHRCLSPRREFLWKSSNTFTSFAFSHEKSISMLASLLICKIRKISKTYVRRQNLSCFYSKHCETKYEGVFNTKKFSNSLWTPIRCLKFIILTLTALELAQTPQVWGLNPLRLFLTPVASPGLPIFLTNWL